MPNRPRIAILGRIATGATSQREDRLAVPLSLTDAVWAAGGEPIIIAPARYPEATELDGLNWGHRLKGIDAVLMPGGGDLDPKTYGQTAQTTELYGVNPTQDRADLSLIHYALAAGLPLLTVCRGTQALNVALGGTLHQHIGEAHRNLGHPVTLSAQTAAALGIKTSSPELSAASTNEVTLTASCHHHQALDQVAPELEVLATSADGFIEAVQVRGAGWAFGVQWHPEDNYRVEPANLDLFKALVEQGTLHSQPHKLAPKTAPKTAQKNEPGHSAEPTLFARLRARNPLKRVRG